MIKCMSYIIFSSFENQFRTLYIVTHEKWAEFNALGELQKYFAMFIIQENGQLLFYAFDTIRLLENTFQISF